jgi:hypothetical protein
MGGIIGHRCSLTREKHGQALTAQISLWVFHGADFSRPLTFAMMSTVSAPTIVWERIGKYLAIAYALYIGVGAENIAKATGTM